MRVLVVPESARPGNMHQSITDGLMRVYTDSCLFLFPRTEIKSQLSDLMNSELQIAVKTYKPDILFVIGPGTQVNIPVGKFLKVNWQFDDPWGFQHGYDKVAENYDVIFTTDINSVNRYKNGYYAPPGYNPAIYKPLNCKKEIDISFVGSVYAKRQNMLRVMKGKLGKKLKIFGGFNTRSDLWDVKKYLDNTEQAQVINKTILNLSFSDQPDGVPSMKLRPFEVIGCNGILVSDYYKPLVDLIPEDCAIYYNSVTQGIQKMLEVLGNKTLQQKITSNVSKVKEKYTYVNIVKKYVYPILGEYK